MKLSFVKIWTCLILTLAWCALPQTVLSATPTAAKTSSTTTKSSKTSNNSAQNSCQKSKKTKKTAKLTGFPGGNALISPQASIDDEPSCEPPAEAKPARTEPLQCRPDDKKCQERYQRFKKSQTGSANWEPEADANRDGRVDEQEWKRFKKDGKTKAK